jgi:hypothetical protein
MLPADCLTELEGLLASKAFRYSTEAELQEGLRRVLVAAAIPFEKEFRLSAKDRLDFFVRGSVAIETKIGRSLASLTRQVNRYTQDARVGGVLVVSTRLRLQNLPERLNDKPVRVCVLLSSML